MDFFFFTSVDIQERRKLKLPFWMDTVRPTETCTNVTKIPRQVFGQCDGLNRFENSLDERLLF